MYPLMLTFVCTTPFTNIYYRMTMSYCYLLVPRKCWLCKRKDKTCGTIFLSGIISTNILNELLHHSSLIVLSLLQNVQLPSLIALTTPKEIKFASSV
jgi:hypothetical protein